MYLGYNTNGLPHHATMDALEVISSLGYRGVALTLDHHCLPPGGATLASDLAAVRRRLKAVCAEALPLVRGGASVVIRALPSAATVDYADLRADVVRCLQRKAAA